MPFGGTIDNIGTIALASTGDATNLEILFENATLQVGGQVTLSESNQNVIFGGSAEATNAVLCKPSLTRVRGSWFVVRGSWLVIGVKGRDW